MFKLLKHYQIFTTQNMLLLENGSEHAVGPQIVSVNGLTIETDAFSVNATLDVLPRL